MDADARTRLILTTSRLLQTQGYHKTGLNQILAESNSPKGSLYYYFPGGKVDLAVASIQHSADTLSKKLAELCLVQPSARQGLEAVLDFFLAELEGSGFAKGCPVATVTLEQAALNDPIQQASAAAYGQWQRGLEDWLHHHKVINAAALAEHFLASVEGVLMLARARRSGEPLRQLKRHLALLPGLTGAAL